MKNEILIRITLDKSWTHRLWCDTPSVIIDDLLTKEPQGIIKADIIQKCIGDEKE